MKSAQGAGSRGALSAAEVRSGTPKGTPVLQALTFYRKYFRSVASPCLGLLHQHADLLLDRSHLCLLSTARWGRTPRPLARRRQRSQSCSGAVAEAAVLSFSPWLIWADGKCLGTETAGAFVE